MKTLGILGGLGPESSGEFYLSLVKRFQEICQPKTNEEYPHILINSIPAQELTSGKITKEILDVYKNGLKELEAWSADSVVIVCNTAYCYFDELQESVSVPIWNLVEEVKKVVQSSMVKHLLVLASPTSIRCGLFDFPSISSVHLSDEEVDSLGNLISQYNLTGNVENSALRPFLEKATDDTVLIAGCTEIAQILRKINIPFLDPMEIIMNAIVNQWFESKNGLLKVRESKIHGQGVFAQDFIPNKTVFYKVPTQNVSDVPMKKWVQLDGKWYCDNSVMNWVNHSCEPSARIVMHEGVPALVALKDVSSVEEVTCDYNVTEIGGTQVECNCQSDSCRGYFLRIDD